MISETMLTPAFINLAFYQPNASDNQAIITSTHQTAHSLKHFPPGIVLSQKNAMGVQKKIELMIVQQDHAKTKVMRA